jgi:TrwC relaxase
VKAAPTNPSVSTWNTPPRPVREKAAYYDHELSVEDYYVSRAQEPGVWVGSGAAVLGLSGEVEEGQLALLFDEGCHPVSGVPLGLPYRHDSKRTVVTGFALSFSPPKSVSLKLPRVIGTNPFKRSQPPCRTPGAGVSSVQALGGELYRMAGTV